MICSRCGTEAVESNDRCTRCGAPLHPGPHPSRPTGLRVPRLLLTVALAGLGLAALLNLSRSTRGPATPDASQAADGVSLRTDAVTTHSPGQAIDIERLVVSGQTTVFDFYSDGCPPCRRISPRLAELDRRRDDVVVRKIDINRPGINGIDWQSPVVAQYGIRSIPHFILYDPAGRRSHEGPDATREVLRLLEESGIR